MIGLIARKDFLLNLKSARFIIGFVICLFVIPFTLIVSIDKYKGRIIFYESNSEKAETNLKNNKVYSFVRPEIVAKPEALSIFNEGITDNLGTETKIQLREYPLFLSGQAGSLDNPLLNRFSSIDFSTVIAIILSLFALVFSYDSFSREKEDSTMRMVLINKISRTRFFLGKLCGILLTILPILIFCFLLSIIFVVVSPRLNFTGTDWMGILLLFVSSIVYVIVFILLGMFVSSMVKQSSTAIIVSLLIWIWFLFLVPGIASYSAKSFVKTGLYDNVQYAMNDMDNDLWKEYGEESDRIQKSLNMRGLHHWNMNGGGDASMLSCGGPRETGEFYLKIVPWLTSKIMNDADKKWALQKEYYDGLIVQEKVRQNLALFSPSEIFQQLSSSLCRTDADAHLKYMEKIREYRESVIQYFKDNKTIESSLWFTPHRIDQYVPMEEYEKIIQRYNECKNDEEFRNFFESLPKEWSSENHPNLNLEDFPRFNYASKDDMQNIVLYRLALLLFIGLLLLGGTMIRFQKYQI